MRRRSLSLGGHDLPYDGTATTRVFLLLGHPVAHSLSPRFQGAALRALGLDAVYLSCDVPAAGLPAAITELRAVADRGLLAGANVTLPHKSAVLPFLDHLDPQAGLAGACNTVVVSTLAGAGGGAAPRLHGHNTDVEGVLAVLEAEAVQVAGHPVVVVGSGGMARAAVVAALRAAAAEIRVLSRSAERGRGMLEALVGRWHGGRPRLQWAALGAVPAGFLADATLLVQATSLGLAVGDPSPLSLAGAPPHLFVLETIYHPPVTALLHAARRSGRRGVNGLGLLVYQGAAALQLWCSCVPPLQVMRRSVGLE